MKNKLLSCMCLAAVLGLGACGGTGNGSKANIILTEPPVSGSVVVSEEIKDRELKKDETLYIYLGDTSFFKFTGFKNYVSYVNNLFVGSSQTTEIDNSKAYYTIEDGHYTVSIKGIETNETIKTFNFVGSDLKYCVVGIE